MMFTPNRVLSTLEKRLLVKCRFSYNFDAMTRNDWTIEEIQDIYNTPLLDLISFMGSAGLTSSFLLLLLLLLLSLETISSRITGTLSGWRLSSP